MRFRVNEGQEVPQVVGLPGGKAERKILTAGDIVEGPPWWIDEFRGRMTAIDDDGNVIDTGLGALSGDLATARAHERVTMIEDMLQRNPGLKSALEPELEKAKAEADKAGEEFRAKQAERAKATAQGGTGGVKIPAHGHDPVAVKQVESAAPAGGDVKKVGDKQ